MTSTELFRQAQTRTRVLRHYARLDHALDVAYVGLLLLGRERQAHVVFNADRLVLRAFLAERDDPTPAGLGA